MYAAHLIPVLAQQFHTLRDGCLILEVEIVQLEDAWGQFRLALSVLWCLDGKLQVEGIDAKDLQESMNV